MTKRRAGYHRRPASRGLQPPTFVSQRPHHPSPLRRLALAWLLLCLVLAQSGLLLHRLVHAGPQPAQVHAEPQADHPLHALFATHADSGDCLNFDHACGADGAPAPILAVAAQQPPMPAAQALPWHFHRPAPAGYDARAPPLAT